VTDKEKLQKKKQKKKPRRGNERKRTRTRAHSEKKKKKNLEKELSGGGSDHNVFTGIAGIAKRKRGGKCLHQNRGKCQNSMGCGRKGAKQSKT